MSMRAGALLLVAMSVGFVVAGCGMNPVSPTDVTTDVVSPSITVLPTSAVAVPGGSLVASGEPALRVPASAVAGGAITITVVQVPSISVTVMPGETATITGLPPGAYTLVFTQNGTVVGQQSIVGVLTGQTIAITVALDGGDIVFVIVIIGTTPTPPPSPCTIDGRPVGSSLVIEGAVVSGNGNTFRMNRNGNHARELFDVDASGASYRCRGRSGPSCQANLGTGTQVHVEGTLLGCTATAVVITASEVTVQKP